MFQFTLFLTAVFVFVKSSDKWTAHHCEETGNGLLDGARGAQFRNFQHLWTDDTCNGGIPNGDIFSCYYGFRRIMFQCEGGIHNWVNDPRDDRRVYALLESRVSVRIDGYDNCFYNEEDALEASQTIHDASADFLCAPDDDDTSSSSSISDESSSSDDVLFLTSCYFQDTWDILGTNEFFAPLTPENCDNGFPDDFSTCAASINYIHIGSEEDFRIYLDDPMLGTGFFARDLSEPLSIRWFARFRLQILCGDFQSAGYRHYVCTADYKTSDFTTDQQTYEFEPSDCILTNVNGNEDSSSSNELDWDEFINSQGCLATMRATQHGGYNSAKDFKAIAPQESLFGVNGPGISFIISEAMDRIGDTFAQIDYFCPN